MSDASKRTVWVTFLAGLAVTLSKVGAGIVTSSPAMAAEASHSLVHALEAGLKGESRFIYRADIVPVGTGGGG